MIRAISYKSVIRKIENESKDGDYISGGHIDHRTFSQFDCRIQYITMLRDPVARFVSEYNYSRNGFFKKPLHIRWDAGAKAKLAGRYNLHDYAVALQEQSDVFGNIAARFLGIDQPSTIKTRFEDDVYIAGILENLESFRRRLCDKSGFDVPPVRLNSAPRNFERDINRKTIAIIEDLYALDFDIYEFARKF